MNIENSVSNRHWICLSSTCRYFNAISMFFFQRWKKKQVEMTPKYRRLYRKALSHECRISPRMRNEWHLTYLKRTTLSNIGWWASIQRIKRTWITFQRILTDAKQWHSFFIRTPVTGPLKQFFNVEKIYRVWFSTLLRRFLMSKDCWNFNVGKASFSPIKCSILPFYCR